MRTEPVLTREQLVQLVETTRTVERAYCRAKPDYFGRDCRAVSADTTKPKALDLEVRVLATSRLVVKQVREFGGGCGGRLGRAGGVVAAGPALGTEGGAGLWMARSGGVGEVVGFEHLFDEVGGSDEQQRVCEQRRHGQRPVGVGHVCRCSGGCGPVG